MPDPLEPEAPEPSTGEVPQTEQNPEAEAPQPVDLNEIESLLASIATDLGKVSGGHRAKAKVLEALHLISVLKVKSE